MKNYTIYSTTKGIKQLFIIPFLFTLGLLFTQCNKSDATIKNKEKLYVQNNLENGGVFSIEANENENLFYSEVREDSTIYEHEMDKEFFPTQKEMIDAFEKLSIDSTDKESFAVLEDFFTTFWNELDPNLQADRENRKRNK